MMIKFKPFFLFEIALVILLFQQNVFPSEYTSLTLMLSILAGLMMIFKDKKIYTNPYLNSYLIFIFFAVGVSMVGQGVGDVKDRLLLILAQSISSFCIYNYLMRIDNIDRFLKLFVIVAIVSLIIILLLVGDRATISRLGHNGSGAIVSYYIGGTPIYKSSNGTANMCAIASLFLLYYAEYYGRKKCYIGIILLTIGLLLTGSRKGLLLYVIFILYIYFFMNKGVTPKKFAAFFLVPMLFYIVFIKIPLVYDVIGIRIESMIMNIFNQSNKLDGNSYLMRKQLESAAMEWISQKPVFGSGLYAFQESTGYGTENNVLQILVEFGFVGATIYYSFIFPMVRNIIKNSKKTVLTGIFSVLVLTILFQDYGSVTYPWQRMTMWYSIFWAVMNRESGKSSAEFILRRK